MARGLPVAVHWIRILKRLDSLSHHRSLEMEVKVSVDGIQRVVCGITEETTCQDVVVVLAQALGKYERQHLLTKRMIIINIDALLHRPPQGSLDATRCGRPSKSSSGA